MTVEYGKLVVSFTATENSVHIFDSYKICKKADMTAIVKLIRAEAAMLGYKYKRSDSSWVTEWRAHNYMYDHRIQRSRTGSVDLNDNESRLVLAGYAVTAKLYRK